MKIKTFLPVFTGFYNSIFQYNEENQIIYINENREEKNLNDIDFENLDVNYTQYENDISINLCKILEKKLNDYVIKIDFENIYSPKTYNFSNDSINCVIQPKINNIKDFIYKNKNEFKDYLKANYTSCDGFISGYSNNFNIWKEETKDFTDFDINSHFLGSILNFICEMLEIEETNLYYEILENFDFLAYINNYEELNTCLLCECCNNLITNKKDLKIIEKYYNIMNKYPKNAICNKCNN